MEKNLKKYSIVHPKKDELGKIDQLVSEKLQYPAGCAYSDDFPRMLSESNINNLYGVKDSGSGEWNCHVGALPLTFINKDDQELKLLILGAVATETESQGQGLASSLIETIISFFPPSQSLTHPFSHTLSSVVQSLICLSNHTLISLFKHMLVHALHFMAHPQSDLVSFLFPGIY